MHSSRTLLIRAPPLSNCVLRVPVAFDLCGRVVSVGVASAAAELAAVNSTAANDERPSVSIESIESNCCCSRCELAVAQEQSEFADCSCSFNCCIALATLGALRRAAARAAHAQRTKISSGGKCQ